MTIELHTWNTPNGRKISVALEEMGLPYKVIPVNITKGEQMALSFLAISPKEDLPRSSIRYGPEGKARQHLRASAILPSSARRPVSPAEPLAERIPVDEWLMWQMGGFV